MTVTLPGGPGGPSFSLAPRLCNGFLGCSFQALVEPRQFSWQVVLFHTPETLRGLKQAAVPKPQEPPARHTHPGEAWRLQRQCFGFLGEGELQMLQFEKHTWIIGGLWTFKKKDISKSMMKPNIFTSMTTIKKPVPNNQLQPILFNISNTSWWWKYRPKVNQRNAVLVLMMMIIAAFLFSSFKPLSVQAF